MCRSRRRLPPLAVALALALPACTTLGPYGSSAGTTTATPVEDPLLAACRQALAAPADIGDPWFLLGNAYAEQGRLSEAEDAYRRALERAAHPRAQHNLALVQLQLGMHNLREAARQLPARDRARAETREFLRALMETAP